MALTKTTRPDGGTHFHHDGDPRETVIYTGPIYNVVETADGTRYRVSEDFIAVPTEHAGEVMHAIGVRHEAEGHPTHGNPDDEDYEPFMHECSDACGALKRSKSAHPKRDALLSALRNGR